MLSEDLNVPDLFVCTRCGDCCKGYGGTYVCGEDIAAIAAFLHMEPSETIRRYCRMSGGKYLLGQRPDGYCLLYENACTIHPVKPHMCRQWPFIDSVLVDSNNWLIMAGVCPGMRTDVPLRHVQACVERVLNSAGQEHKR